MRRLDDMIEHQDVLAQLCRLRARPPVIRDLLPDSVPAPAIYMVYRKINNCAPPRGQLPQEIKTFLSTPQRRLQATLAVCAYNRHIRLAPEDRCRLFINVFQTYQSAFGSDALYDFNRVWFLLRQYVLDRLGLAKCQCCGNHFLVNREDVSDWKKCCSCALLQKLQKTTEASPAPTLLLPDSQVLETVLPAL